MSSKHADRTYADPPASLPRRGAPPPLPPTQEDISNMDHAHRRAWHDYAQEIENELAEYELTDAAIDQHLTAERKAVQLGATETAEEIQRRAAIPSQWVKIDATWPSVSSELMAEACEARCCLRCNKREYPIASSSRRLYGTRICIGRACYERLRKNGVPPRLTVPTTGEVASARDGHRTDDPFIVNAKETMDGWSTTKDNRR